MKQSKTIATRLNKLAGVTGPEGRNVLRPEYFSNEVQKYEAENREDLIIGWNGQSHIYSFRQYVVNQYLTTKQ